MWYELIRTPETDREPETNITIRSQKVISKYMVITYYATVQYSTIATFLCRSNTVPVKVCILNLNKNVIVTVRPPSSKSCSHSRISDLIRNNIMNKLRQKGLKTKCCIWMQIHNKH